MTARAEVDGDEIVIRVRIPKAPESGTHATGDRLIRLEQQAAAEAGFELAALRRKVASGDLPSVKLGRATYVRMSDLCALVTAKPSTVDADYARALATPPRRRRHGT